MFFELCTAWSSLHVYNRSCLSCFVFWVSYARLALINGYECLVHAHQLSVSIWLFLCVKLFCFGSLCEVWLQFFKTLLVLSDEKRLLTCCAARDTHFSAEHVYRDQDMVIGVCPCVCFKSDSTPVELKP